MSVLSFASIGTGHRKVIAAHTWLADHQTYGPMMPFLDTEGAAFVFPDFRGYGESRHLKGAFTIREMGRDLLALADSLGWQRFHLVGNSMGGQAAQWLAGQSEVSGRIESLTLLCAVPAAGFPLDPESAAFFKTAIDNLDVRGKCAAAVTGGRLDPAFESYMARLSSQTATREAIGGYLEAWTNEDVSSEIETFARPTRIFVGAYDPVLTDKVAETKILPLFPGAQLATIAGAGHYPSLETPAYAAALLNEVPRAEAARGA